MFIEIKKKIRQLESLFLLLKVLKNTELQSDVKMMIDEIKKDIEKIETELKHEL